MAEERINQFALLARRACPCGTGAGGQAASSGAEGQGRPRAVETPQVAEKNQPVCSVKQPGVAEKKTASLCLEDA